MTNITGLCYSNYVFAYQNGRDTVRLDRSRSLVLAQLDVLKHDGVQTSVLELFP
jgi:hypothetical protein